MVLAMETGSVELQPVAHALGELETTQRALEAEHAEAVQLVEAARAKAEDIGARLGQTRAAIDVLRQLTGGTGSPAPAAQPGGVVLQALAKGRPGRAASASRETSILLLLDEAGSLTAAQLRARLRPAPGVTEEQHRQSIANTLVRLREAGRIHSVEAHGWGLTREGRRLAGIRRRMVAKEGL